MHVRQRKVSRQLLYVMLVYMDNGVEVHIIMVVRCKYKIVQKLSLSHLFL